MIPNCTHTDEVHKKNARKPKKGKSMRAEILSHEIKKTQERIITADVLHKGYTDVLNKIHEGQVLTSEEKIRELEHFKTDVESAVAIDIALLESLKKQRDFKN